MGNMAIKIDKYFEQTRIEICFAKDCFHNRADRDAMDCNLKQTLINNEGKCYHYKPKSEVQK